MAGTPTLSPGVVFASDFRVIRQLGHGGMGAVYEVEQLSTGKGRALKLMHPQLVSDDKSHERFVQEARAGARVDSEHVVEVIAAGVDMETGSPWLAMELLEGETLAERLERLGRLSPGEIAPIVEQLGHALAAAHDGGLVHRDLKPENLFLARSRRSGVELTLKVLDFGIAKVLHGNRTAGVTTSGIGTPMWMAPEQTDAGNVRPATDVWALGLLVYTMLTGKPYWKSPNTEGGTLNGLFVELVVEPLEPASVRAARYGVESFLPARFDDWFARCVVRELDRRFPHAREAVAALMPLLGCQPSTPRAAAAAFADTLPSQPQPDGPTTEVGTSTTSPVDVPARLATAPSAPRFGLGLGIAVGVVGLLFVGGAVAVGVGMLPADTPEERTPAATEPPVTPPIVPIQREPPAGRPGTPAGPPPLVPSGPTGTEPPPQVPPGPTSAPEPPPPQADPTPAPRTEPTPQGLDRAEREEDRFYVQQLRDALRVHCSPVARAHRIDRVTLTVRLTAGGGYDGTRFSGQVPRPLIDCLNTSLVVQFPAAAAPRRHRLTLRF